MVFLRNFTWYENWNDANGGDKMKTKIKWLPKKLTTMSGLSPTFIKGFNQSTNMSHQSAQENLPSVEELRNLLAKESWKWIHKNTKNEGDCYMYLAMCVYQRIINGRGNGYGKL